jgi:competence protein ComEC
MIDVNSGGGQGDAHLIVLPSGQAVAIDLGLTGNGPEACRDALRKRGISHLELVVLTHYHRDHYGSLLEVIDSGITVGRVIHTPPTLPQCARESPWGCSWGEIEEIARRLTEKNIPMVRPSAGDVLIESHVEGVETRLEVVCAFDGLNTPIGPTDMNDMSIVCRLVHGKMKVLFTGDLNSSMGAYLARTPSYDLQVDLLKAPHHGAEGTVPNEFFDRVNPKAVLVPCPKALWLSERCSRVRTYFEQHHTPTYVNGLNGAVTARIKPTGFEIQCEHS